MNRRRLFLSFALVLLAASAVMQVRSGNGGDKNWLLLAAKMWLSGKKLYVDIFEIDPPFVIWLYAIPEWLSQQLSISDSAMIGLTGLFGCGLSVFLSWRLIRYHPSFAGNARRQLDFALLLAAVFLFFNTQIYFFDREHIFFVLTFPYMLRFMPSLARLSLPLPLKLAIALMASVGFCIKPYTLVVFAILQLIFIFRERSAAILFSIENAIIYVGGALYLLCIWLFAREYLTVVMPMAMATYSGYSRRLNNYLFLAVAFLSAGLTFVEVRFKDKSPFRRDSYYFIGVAGAFLAYAFANNGWGYTWNLLLCMLIFSSGWMLWDYGSLKHSARENGEPSQRFAFGGIGCIANLSLNAGYMILCLVTFFTAASCASYAECNLNNRYIAYFKQHDIHSFGALTMNLRIFTVLARWANASWDTRFNHLWMLPELLQEGEPLPENHRWIVNYIGKGFAEDLNNRKPDVVFVDRNDGLFGYPHPVDMIAYFSRVPEFKEAWRHYVYADTIDQCPAKDAKATPAPLSTDCRFAIYSRMPLAEKAIP